MPDMSAGRGGAARVGGRTVFVELAPTAFFRHRLPMVSSSTNRADHVLASAAMLLFPTRRFSTTEVP
jgi:hypothetical protein